MQLESDLLWNNGKDNYDWRRSRAMGYGLYLHFRRDGLKFYKYGSYEIQVFKGIELMRRAFDAWKEGAEKEIIDLKMFIVPQNAGTYALHVYNPFYGKHNEYGWEEDAIGNKAFESLIPSLLKRWKEINN